MSQEIQNNFSLELPDRRLSDVFDYLQSPITYSQLIRVYHKLESIIVIATSSANQLFGRKETIAGQLIADIHHPLDAHVARLYALSRRNKKWAPEIYPIRVSNPEGEPIILVKKVKQVKLENTTVWLSLHRPFDESQPFMMPITPHMVSISSQENSEKHAFLINERKQYPVYEPEEAMLHYQDFFYANLFGEKELQEFERLESFLLKTQENQRPHYTCFKCSYVWYGSIGTPEPERCPSCKERGWNRVVRSRKVT